MKNNFSQNTSIYQKLRDYDYVLLMSILILGVISIFAMYSTDGGEILFHTKSHFVKFSIFFPMMIVLSLSLIHISEPTRPEPISYAVFCLKKKTK